MHKSHVAIIGGGCAGLSAAAALAERGYQVTIFEAASQLGGRARSVAVEINGQIHLLDNGQHILLGAYQETLALLKKVGVDEQQAFLRLPLNISMQSPAAAAIFQLKSWHWLPAPLNLLAGLLFSKGLNIKEHTNVLNLMHELRANNFTIMRDQPLVLFLMQRMQSKNLIEFLWQPLCLAALNTPIDQASTRVFLNVLRDAFTGSKHNSDLLLPRMDLSQIISEPLANYITSHGGTINLNSRVNSVMQCVDGFNIETKRGNAHFSHVVVACSPARVEKLFSKLPKLQSVAEQLKHYEFQPIYTVYLQYPHDVRLPAAMCGMSGTISQWVFDRGLLCDQHNMVSVIISAEGSHQHLTQDELAFKVAKELNQAFPSLGKPLWHKVIAEKRATFACRPNLSRPTNRTPIANLYLTGDYTYADYPATIEGAIRSGAYCAQLIDSISD